MQDIQDNKEEIKKNKKNTKVLIYIALAFLVIIISLSIWYFILKSNNTKLTNERRNNLYTQFKTRNGGTIEKIEETTTNLFTHIQD